jgi:hypothetical protein
MKASGAWWRFIHPVCSKLKGVRRNWRSFDTTELPVPVDLFPNRSGGII